MKKVLILFMVLLACLCNEEGMLLTEFLNTDKLDARYYEINLKRDTLLRTKGGAEIEIDRGAIQTGGKRTSLK